MRKNEIITAEITGTSAEGNGVCRDSEGFTIFVPGTAIGDVAEVRIVKILKNYSFGRLEKIIAPSPSRVEPDCPVFSQCGGCVYRHISYAEELKIKQTRVRDALLHIGGFENIPLAPIVGAESIYGYRNKAQLPVGKNSRGEIEIGFYSTHSHRIINSASCRLQPEIFNRTAAVFRDFLEQSENEPYDELSHKGRVRHLYMRYAQATGELMVCPVVNAGGLKDENKLLCMLKSTVPELKTLIINTNTDKTNVVLGRRNRTVYGDGYISNRLCGCTFRISPLSFYQVNHAQTERLYNIVREYAELSSSDVLFDLYCGTGTIGLTMAKYCKKLIGVETVEQAVSDARTNALINNCENAEFICADATLAAEQLKHRGERPDVIVIDPPRKGCDRQLIQTITTMSPRRTVYVSCDPATLARDLKIFAEKGYIPRKITPVDMFPRTAHVECVVLMSREKAVWEKTANTL